MRRHETKHTYGKIISNVNTFDPLPFFNPGIAQRTKITIRFRHRHKHESNIASTIDRILKIVENLKLQGASQNLKIFEQSI
jgi:hypothetical protein